MLLYICIYAFNWEKKTLNDTDIRDLISVEDVMDDKELRFGPNGGLIFCMELVLGILDYIHSSIITS